MYLHKTTKQVSDKSYFATQKLWINVVPEPKFWVYFAKFLPHEYQIN